MPELPEVETIRTDLTKLLVGEQIIDLECLFAGSIVCDSLSAFRKQILRQKITKIERRGKYLLLYLGKKQVLVIHLRMTGQLVVGRKNGRTEEPKNQKTKKLKNRFTRLIFRLSHQKTLYFNDIRKFGRVFLIRSSELAKHPALSKLGVEPLSPAFTFQVFEKLLGQNTRIIKPFLLDQSKVSGLGNIYVDESLFAAGIHPQTPINKLSAPKRKLLHRKIREILKKAVAKRGTSSRNYVDSFAKTGNYQNFLKVYGKKGQPCPVCGTPIKRIVVAQRGTHYCEKCQTVDRNS